MAQLALRDLSVIIATSWPSDDTSGQLRAGYGRWWMEYAALPPCRAPLYLGSTAGRMGCWWMDPAATAAFWPRESFGPSTCLMELLADGPRTRSERPRTRVTRTALPWRDLWERADAAVYAR